MWNKGLEVKLCTEQLGLDLNMDSFNERLEVQKNVYLMQVFGVDLGFRYGWYLRGPYCSELTKVAFDLKEEQELLADTVEQLQEDVIYKINRFKQWADSTKPVRMAKIDWLELLASLHYLKHIAYIRLGKSQEVVCNELINRKNWYTREDVNYAWEKLDEVGLIERVELSA